MADPGGALSEHRPGAEQVDAASVTARHGEGEWQVDIAGSADRASQCGVAGRLAAVGEKHVEPDRPRVSGSDLVDQSGLGRARPGPCADAGEAAVIQRDDQDALGHRFRAVGQQQVVSDIVEPASQSRLVEPGRAQQADEQHQPPFAAQPALLDRAAHRRAVTSKPCCADQVAITLLPNGISESTCH